MSLRSELETLAGAIRFFTRLPLPGTLGHSGVALTKAIRYFPLAGALVAAIAALVFALCMLFWPKTLAVLAAITTVISASGGMAAVQKGLQKLTPGARKTMFDRLWAVLYTFLFEGLMLVAMVVQSLSPILRGLAGLLPLHTLVGGLLQRLHSLLSISAVLSLALSLLTVTLIYTYVPGGKRRIRDQLPGAAAVVAVWTLFSKIFSFYIGHFWKLSYIYGSLAAIVLITLWLNVNINVLFLGAGLNAKIQGMGQEKKEPDA